MTKKYKSRGDKLYKVGIAIFFFALLLATIYIGIKYLRLSKSVIGTGVVDNNTSKTNSVPTTAETESRLKEYMSEEYGFVFKYRKFLSPNTFEDAGDYFLFVRFEENQFSKSKGIALGVTSRTVDKEVERVKMSISKDFGVDTNEEGKIRVDKYEGTKIVYEEREGFEARSIVVFSNGKHTFSISTIPDQINEVISNFTFN